MLVERYGAGYIFFVDDIFTLNKRWVYELLDLLNKEDWVNGIKVWLRNFSFRLFNAWILVYNIGGNIPHL